MRQRYDSVAPIVAEMKTHVWVAAIALVILGLTTGCERTTAGTVAMTTQPGPPLTYSPRTPPRANPNFPIPGLPNIPKIPIPGFPGPRTNVPVVPAPPDALTMTCEKFNGLDEATRLAVVRAVLAQQNNPLGPNGEDIGQMLTEAACQFMPQAKVSEVLGSQPR
jgi:hypothetical protein